MGAPAQWDALLDDCAAMGFDALVLGSPFARGEADDPLLVADYAQADPRLGWGDDPVAALHRLARRCAAKKLALMLDLTLDRCLATNPDVQAQPQLYSLRPLASAPPPDPRQPASASRFAAYANYAGDEAAVELGEVWCARLQTWTQAGVAGFRCLFPQRVPHEIWRTLIAGVRKQTQASAFTAWTPGVTAAEAAELEGCGFDTVYSSLPWWDFHADWWLDEDQRLRCIAPVSAPLEDPLGVRLADRCTDAEQYRRAATRLLDFAAAFADGMLVARGFETGANSAQQNAPLIDLRAQIRRANDALARRRHEAGRRTRDLLGANAPLIAWLTETSAADIADAATHRQLLLVNRDLERVVVSNARPVLRSSGACSRFVAPDHVVGNDTATPLESGSLITLEPGEVRVLVGETGAPIDTPASDGDAAILKAARAPRIALEHPVPCVDDGRFAVKRTVGERVHVEIDAFSDGHDTLAVELRYRPADTRTWKRVRMRALGNDRWAGEFPLERVGRHFYTVQAWRDAFATLHSDLEKKLGADALSDVDLQDACDMVERAAGRARGKLRTELRGWVRRLGEGDRNQRAALLLDAGLAAAMAGADPKPFAVEYPVSIAVEAERLAARFGSWYELFPRSQSGAADRHGSFDDVIARLPAIRDMGFDVLYMPPIHPIGRGHRKGRNNALVAAPDDPGSPYAIGGAEGGHDAIHPELGSFEDFTRLRERAAALGIELALDFAIQCSPDHPWLREHPEWFAWRTDGSVRYAENPPKKYEDIVNIDFYAGGAVPELWRALRDVLLFWAQHGVRLFRVDNPHTKPYGFWEWMIADVRGRHPDVVFLAEAFTRPKPMYHLAKLGFSQSYTYFTWRHGKSELTDYFNELAHSGVREYFRPHLFVNTPDINPVFLQQSGRAGFLIRAALATTLSGLWGMYSGFELCESEPIPGREEYLHSEKYQLKPRDWEAPGNIVAEIRRLNAIRRDNPALHDHRNVTFYNAFNDQILYFCKATPGRDNAILVAINLDPHAAQEADFEVPLWEWQLPDHASMVAQDLMRGRREVWHGKLQHVRLDPSLPFAIWRIHPGDA
jgi:starch synthase (maltosyl-transferring)